MSPPRFTAVLRSNVGTTPAFFAFVERTHQIALVVKFTPPMKRLPAESTSNVPHAGEFGISVGFIHVDPPSVDRVNCLPPKLFPSVLQYWYWNPRPELLVLSIVNHCLPPPSAGPTRVHN